MVPREVLAAGLARAAAWLALRTLPGCACADAAHCRTLLYTALPSMQKLIDHAIRFTGPNSRQAYELPAEHFAPHGTRVCYQPTG